MKSLSELFRLNKTIRIIGFDDSPFDQQRGSVVHVSGIVCSETRMEGMLWFEAAKDGNDATDALITSLRKSKFLPQLHAILIDGIAFGGFNVLDVKKVSTTLKIPCITVMRKYPNLERIKAALQNFDDGSERLALIKDAGEIHQHQSELSNNQFYYQAAGCTPEEAAMLLERVTDNGNVPEALRLAHLIGSAVKTGQSSNSA